MTQSIDPARLRAAAKHLEWVLQQYPDNEDVQLMHRGMCHLIDDAREGRISVPVDDSAAIPFRWAVSAEGLFRDYCSPDVERAYVDFVVELMGGLTDEEKRILADIASAPSRG